MRDLVIKFLENNHFSCVDTSSDLYTNQLKS